MKLARQLSKWRKARAWTQKAAAEFLQVSVRTYEQWESGNAEPRGLARLSLLKLIQ